MTVKQVEFVTAKTQELTGIALDWFVCQVATGAEFNNDYGSPCLVVPGSIALLDGLQRDGLQRDGRICVPSYNSSWELMGPLIESFGLNFNSDINVDGYMCYHVNPKTLMFYGRSGDTHLQAACRVIIQSKFGSEVSVPKVILDESLLMLAASAK